LTSKIRKWALLELIHQSLTETKAEVRAVLELLKSVPSTGKGRVDTGENVHAVKDNVHKEVQEELVPKLAAAREICNIGLVKIVDVLSRDQGVSRTIKELKFRLANHLPVHFDIIWATFYADLVPTKYVFDRGKPCLQVRVSS
jgi:hypothetical protein